MSRLPPSERLADNVTDALADQQLRTALRRATNLFAERRRHAVSTLTDWEALREHARAIKEHTLRHLDHYLGEFADRAEQAGTIVHWAPDAERARQIVLEIAQQCGARTVVKSKSMTTEEIHLNDALQAAGLETVETDLGEWIVQLADEAPSHIIVPAIHKTRQQIGALLAERIGMAETDDPAALTAAARAFLRQRFASADLGITGVNFAIAETGAFLVLENEGNARLTATLPKTHIAIMGIEKVIPATADLEVFLRLLPRSGTGQHLTSYQTLFGGPKPNATDEGPDTIHVVILDHGRSRMLGHPVTRQSLACIRCGACLNACPVYQQIGGHAYGSVYPGPIGAVITPQLAGLAKTAQLPFASSLCGACRDVCPVKIDIPEILLHLRHEVIKATDVSPSFATHQRRRERLGFWLWAMLVKSPWRYRACTGLLRCLQPLALRAGRPTALGRLARPLWAWSKQRDLRPLATRPFRALWPELEREATR